MHTIHRVREFHLAFGHPVESKITIPSAKTRLLRFKLLFEEVMEYGRAVGIEGLCETTQEDFEADLKVTMSEFKIASDHVVDQVEAADALGDIDYVCAGANLCHGFPAEAVAIEIHRSNMSKTGEDGKPVLAADGKVIKGPNYSPPDIKTVLSQPDIASCVQLERAINAQFTTHLSWPRAYTLVDSKGIPFSESESTPLVPSYKVANKVYGVCVVASIGDIYNSVNFIELIEKKLCAALGKEVLSLAAPGTHAYWRRFPEFSSEPTPNLASTLFKLTLRIGLLGDPKPSKFEVPEGEPIPLLS